MSTNPLLLVVGREMREAMRRKTFWIVVAIAIAGSTAAVVLPDILGGDREVFEVGVVDVSDDVVSSLEAVGTVLDADVHVQTLDSLADAEAAVDAGTVSIAVLGGAEDRIVATAGEDVPLVAAAQQVLARERLADSLEAQGLDAGAITDLLDQPAAAVDVRQADSESRRGAAAVIAVVLYLVLLMLTIQVANGTAIEKANRISEVLLAIVKPAPLLFGKVIAVGLIGFLTLLGGALPVLIKLVAGGSIPNGLPAALLAGGAWYLLGGALYLTIAGALGALVERQEEAGGAVAPLTMLILASYLVGQSASDTALGRVLSIFPLTSTMVMPSRIAIGAATAPEVAASLALSVLAVVFAVRIGSGIYRRAVVRTGRRLKVREVLRAK